MQLSNFICLSILAVTAQSALLPRIFNDTAPCNTTTNTTAFFPTIEKRGFGELPSNHTFPTNGTNSSHPHPHPHPNHPPHHQPRDLTPLEVDNMIKKRFAEEAALRKFSDSL